MPPSKTIVSLQHNEVDRKTPPTGAREPCAEQGDAEKPGQDGMQTI